MKNISKLAFRVFVFACLLAALCQSATRPAVERAAASLKEEVKQAPIPGEFIARFTAEPQDLSGRDVKTAVKIGPNIFRLEFNQELTLAEASQRLSGIADRVEPNVVVVSQTTPTSTVASNWVDALNLEPLFLTGVGRLGPGLPKVRVAFVDSGINCAVFPAYFINLALSRSWVDNDPCTDQAGHGTTVFAVYLGVSDFPTEFVSLKIMGKDNLGTLDNLIAALSQVATWDNSKPTIVNMSLQNFPDSAIISEIMDSLQQNVLFVACVGNNGSSVPNYPGYYSYKPNVLSIGSAEFNGSLSSYSDWGSWVSIAGFGSLAPGVWGTSYAAPQGSGIAADVLALRSDMNPSLVKKVLLNGGLYQQDLSASIGNPTTGLQGRTLNGGGTLNVLQRLETVLLTGYYNTPVPKGVLVSLTVSEDQNWLGQFSLQVLLVDLAGNKTFVPATIANSDITFVAPDIRERTVQLVVEGSIFGNQLRIAPYRRPYPL